MQSGGLHLSGFKSAFFGRFFFILCVILLSFLLFEWQVLEVGAEAVDFFDEEVDVDFTDGLIGNDAPEEVRKLTLGLVAHHEGTGGHHATLQDRRYLSQKSVALRSGRHGAEARRYVPEAHVGALRLGYDQLESVGFLAQFLHHVPRQFHVAIHHLAESLSSLFFIDQFIEGSVKPIEIERERERETERKKRK